MDDGIDALVNSSMPEKALTTWPKSVKSMRMKRAGLPGAGTRSRFTTVHSSSMSAVATARPSLPLPPVTATVLAICTS